MMLPTRRTVLSSMALAGSAALLRPALFGQQAERPLQEFGYDQIRVTAPIPVRQQANVVDILLGLSDDSLLQPFRAIAGRPAPGANIGGWYEYLATYDVHHGDAGFAPGHALGQWISAMARLSVQDSVHGPELAAKARRITAQLKDEVTPAYFDTTRFPAYTLEKFACAMVDMHRILHDATAYDTLAALAEAAAPSLPGHGIDREIQWRLGRDASYMWDENFTLPENLLRASDDEPGNPRFRQLGRTYLIDKTFFEPLSRGENLLADRHAYSYVNSLCSAMQAWFSTGSAMHRQAAENAFAMLQAQSFVTAGWGPDELLRKQGYDDVNKSLTSSHNTFEVACGSFAHAKLTRYLLRATRDGRYGDSMERVLLNTTAGIMPLQADGHTFYYADYNYVAQRIYSVHRWPCCSGTYPQVVADYGINTYLQEPGAVWVNLYQSSELRFAQAGVNATLTQDSSRFLTDGSVRFRLIAATPVAFSVRFRIPQWTSAPVLRVNGQNIGVAAEKGFATVHRTWKSGDTIDLTLPMSLRLEMLAANGGPEHPEAVALLYGPLVLFAVRELGEAGPLALPQTALLQARRTGPMEWTLAESAGGRKLVPFSELGERLYTTYLKAT